MSMTRALRSIAFVLLVLVTGATSIGCTAAAAGKVTTAEMPAPAADPVVSTETSWAEFLDWAVPVSEDGTSIMDDMTADADAQDLDALAIDAGRLYDWANEGTDWLAANPPEACYANIHAVEGSVFDHFGKAGALVKDGVTVAKLKASSSEITQGTAAIKKATALIKKVTC